MQFRLEQAKCFAITNLVLSLRTRSRIIRRKYSWKEGVRRCQRHTERTFSVQRLWIALLKSVVTAEYESTNAAQLHAMVFAELDCTPGAHPKALCLPIPIAPVRTKERNHNLRSTDRLAVLGNDTENKHLE